MCWALIGEAWVQILFVHSSLIDRDSLQHRTTIRAQKFHNTTIRFARINGIWFCVRVHVSRCRHQNMETYFHSDDLQMQQKRNTVTTTLWFDYIYSFHWLVSASNHLLQSIEASKYDLQIFRPCYGFLLAGVMLSCDFVLGILSTDFSLSFFLLYIHLVENCWNTLNTMTQTEKNNKNVRMHLTNEFAACYNNNRNQSTLGEMRTALLWRVNDRTRERHTHTHKSV